MDTVFDSDAHAPGERTQAWVEATAASVIPTRLTFPDEGTFGARLKTMDLGSARLTALSYAALRARRTPALIRRSDPEYYQVTLIEAGRHGFDQAGRRSLVTAGNLVLHDTSHPFEGMVPASSPRSESLMLQFPRKLLPLPERQATRLLAVPLEGAHGTGRLLAHFLRTMADEEVPYSAPDLVRLTGTAIDLVAAALAHHLEGDRDLPPDSRRRALFLQMSAYVQQCLAEPDLGPARLAAAHHISTRHLHRVFQQHGTTVAAFIRRHRLNRCRRDLADPALRAVPVHGIAARWGFPRPGAFTRLFRDATRLTPTEYRAARLPRATTDEARPGARR